MSTKNNNKKSTWLPQGWFLGVLLTASLVLLVSIPVLAQTGGGLDLSWHTIDGGGGTSNSDSDYTLSGTIGQPVAGHMSGGDYTLSGGFWVESLVNEEDSDPDPGLLEVFLPLIFR